MIIPEFNEFKKLCQQGNLIPIYCELLADTETPVSVYSRFADDDTSFLLESVEGGERWGRYSFIGLDPHSIFQVKDGRAIIIENGVEEVLSETAGLLALRELLNASKPVQLPGLPRFFAGAVGYLNYETVNEFEKLPTPKVSSDLPTSCFMLTDTMIIFDNVRHTMKLVACVRPDDFPNLIDAYEDAMQRISKLEVRLAKPADYDYKQYKNFNEAELSSNTTREEFHAMVAKTKDYIVAGDVIQTVLSQRFQTELPAPPLTIYRALRLINPSPYTFFIKFNERLLIGSSPEVMVRLTGDSAMLRPIAGTRPRGVTEQEDRQLADELLQDEKERAEHLMLVDLGRNDLGRVSLPASVQVRDFMSIERYSHVMHIVSNVQSTIKDGLDAFDLIMAAFPAGTLSGAPKIRAMEIIHELEKEPRGFYGGAVGYIGYDGNMDLAITIRTLEIANQTVSLQAGAGIVYDSDPDKEYEETCHKAKALVKALELAATGLQL